MRDEINRDLDDYIGKKRSQDKPFRKAFQDVKNKLKPREQAMGADDDLMGEKPKQHSFMGKIFRRRIPTEEEIESEVGKMPEKDKKELELMEDEVEEIEQEEEVLEEQREGVMSRFFSKLRGQKKEEIPEEPELDPEIESLKDAVKILHTWIQRLPAEEIQRFKQSPDFEKYKEALRKLGMIKE